MSGEDIQSCLNSLNHSQKPENIGHRQLEIVYWYCRLAPGKTELDLRQDIGERMSVSDTTIHTQRQPIAEKLGIEKLRYIPDAYCQVLMSQIPPLPTIKREVTINRGGPDESTVEIEVPDFSKLKWPPPKPENATADQPVEQTGSDELAKELFGTQNEEKPDAISRVLGQTDQGETSSGQGDSGSGDGQQDDESSQNWWLVLIPLVLVCLLGLLGINWWRNRNQNQLPPVNQATVEAAVELTVAAIPPVIQTSIVERVSEVTRVVVETPPPEVISELVASTVAAYPTLPPKEVPIEVTKEVPVVTEVPVTVEVPVEVLVNPEGTVIATNTPIPEDQREFEETFEDGEISEPFRIIEGEPAYVNGVLSSLSEDGLTIQIGDETWTNYELEIQGYVWTTFVGIRSEHFYIDVRAVDLGNSYELASTGYTNLWYIKQNGNRQRVPEDNGGGTRGWPEDGSARLRIVVQDNQIQSYYNNQLQASFFSDTFPNGGAFIRTGDGYSTLRRIRVIRND